MTFGEKTKQARLAANMTQSALAEKTGISERSLYTYEQGSIMPRSDNVRKIAKALNVSVGYLLDDSQTDPKKETEQDAFADRKEKGLSHKSVHKATDILSRITALFESNDLDEKEKDILFQFVTEAYLESKEKFSSQKRASQKKTYPIPQIKPFKYF